MAEIPAIFDQPGAAFVFLRPGAKYPPTEAGWQNKPHNYQEATKHAASGGNVGILAGYGYIGLDKDDHYAFNGLSLPITTLWETRPGRLGLWLRCSDVTPEILAEYGKKPDFAQFKLYKDGQPVGELKLQKTYQVIPNSWKTLEDGSRADYKLLDSSPPAEISLAKLLADLQSIGITFSSKLEANAAKLEANGKKARQRRVESDEARTRKYAAAALRNEVLDLVGTSEGDRNAQLNKSAFALGQFVASRALDEAEVIRELTRAARATGLERDEIERTIRSGLEGGARHPREIPAPENKASTRKEPGASEVSDVIQAKAREILERNDPVKYITDSCGKTVLGADKAFKKLICCVAVQGIRQSAGLHPKLSGESGAGKTWAILTFAHHLPPEAVVKGSSSNLAAFYHSDGCQAFRILDDYQAGNETLDTIIKQTSSVFHQSYDHRTVKKQEPLTLHISSEQTWAITSVDSAQDVQVLNRQIPINIDDSEDLTRKVNLRTIERYGKGEEQFPEAEAVLVCREIWRALRADGMINVRIPYFKRIDWLDTSNRRNPSIFMDLLVAHTAMNRYQRQKDADGYYLATEADFQAAKALFADKDAEELVRRLTRKEREFADLLSRHPGGITREEAAEALNISGNRVSQLANGEKGKGGLTQKLPGFSIQEITDSERVDEDHRRATRRTIYKLTKYDPLTGFEAVVRLLPKNDNGNDSKDGKEPVSNPVRKLESKEIDNGERENREIEIWSKESKEKVIEGEGCPVESSNPSFSLLNPEKSLPEEKSITEDNNTILTGGGANPYRPYSEPMDSESKSLPDSSEKGAASEQIRIACLTEYGVTGHVDPRKIATRLDMSVHEVIAWLDLQSNYLHVEKEGTVFYTQRRSEARA